MSKLADGRNSVVPLNYTYPRKLVDRIDAFAETYNALPSTIIKMKRRDAFIHLIKLGFQAEPLCEDLPDTAGE